MQRLEFDMNGDDRSGLKENRGQALSTTCCMSVGSRLGRLSFGPHAAAVGIEEVLLGSHASHKLVIKAAWREDRLRCIALQVLGFHAEMPDGLPVMDIKNLPES